MDDIIAHLPTVEFILMVHPETPKFDSVLIKFSRVGSFPPFFKSAKYLTVMRGDGDQMSRIAGKCLDSSTSFDEIAKLGGSSTAPSRICRHQVLNKSAMPRYLKVERLFSLKLDQ